MKRDDSLWKSLLEDIFEDFLIFFYPNAGEIFAFGKGFEFLDKELEQLFPPENDMYTTKFVDKLVKVFEKDGTDRWILVHIEIQGYRDPNFAARMFTYYYRIQDKYQKPITAFAIFTDDHPHFHPQKFEQSFLGTHVVYEYNTYKIRDQTEQELLTSNNPFAIVVLTVKAALKGRRLEDEDLFSLKLDLAKNLLSKQIPKKKIRSLLNFLKYYIRFEKRETDVKFEKEMDTVTLNNKTMGIEEFLLDRAEKQGIEKGELKSARTFTRSLLKNTDFSIEKIAQLVDVPVDFVVRIKAKMK